MDNDQPNVSPGARQDHPNLPASPSEAPTDDTGDTSQSVRTIDPSPRASSSTIPSSPRHPEVLVPSSPLQPEVRVTPEVLRTPARMPGTDQSPSGFTPLSQPRVPRDMLLPPEPTRVTGPPSSGSSTSLPIISITPDRSPSTPLQLTPDQMRERMMKRRRANSPGDPFDDISPIDIATWLLEEELAYGTWPDPLTFHTLKSRWLDSGEDAVLLKAAWPHDDVDAVLDQFGLQDLHTTWGIRHSSEESTSVELWPTAIISVIPKDDKAFVWRTKGAQGVHIKTLELVASKIAISVQAKLPQNQCPHFHIEVESPRNFVDNYPYNISVHPNDLDALVTAQRQTLDVVRLLIPDAWCWVGVHTMQRTQLYSSRVKFVPTILVRCREHYSIDFDGLLRAFKRATSIRREGTPLKVRDMSGKAEKLAFRFLVGPDILAATLTASTRKTQHTGFTIRDMENPQLGSSIGPIDVRWSGTLGGFVKLVKKDTNQQKFAILTAGHVLNWVTNFNLPDFVPDTVHEGISGSGGLRSGGIPVSYQPKITITCPSTQDRDAAIEELENSVVITQGYIQNDQELIDKIKGEQELEDLSSGDRAKIARNEKMLGESIEELQQYQHQIGLLKRDMSTFIIGDVLATSPNIIQDCYHFPEQAIRMDWGLVEVTAPRSNSINFANQAPPIYDQVQQPIKPFRGVWQGKTDTPFNQAYWRVGRPVESIGEVRPGIWTCLTGRTTPWTAGSINKVPGRAKWPIDSVQNGKESWEWNVGSESGEESPLQFGDEGDSGSWVLDIDRRLIGLFTGGGATIGYITPINEVITDIEKKLPGWKVELPVEELPVE